VKKKQQSESWSVSWSSFCSFVWKIFNG